MILILFQSDHMLAFSRLQQMLLTGGIAGRLVLAALLGCIIGVDREIRHRPSGVRTNVLICLGAAMFTFLSVIIAGENSTNRGQIASNIVQGIGFLGAGLILHDRDRVVGLTSAATVWAVASIGMACGAGLYFPAIFATVVVLFVLEMVRLLEYSANLKLYSVTYEVRGGDGQKLTVAILQTMDRQNRRMGPLDSQPVGELQRLTFVVSANQRGHRNLQAALEAAPAIDEVHAFRDLEDE